MLMRKIVYCCVAVLLVLPAVSICAADAPGESMIVIQDGKTYRIVDGQPITGKDILDSLIEETWDKELKVFIEHALKEQEITENKIAVTDAECDAELQLTLCDLAQKNGLNPADFKLDQLARKMGLGGGLAALRQEMRDDAGLLKLLIQLKKLKPDTHTAAPKFRQAAREYLEQVMSQKGVITDPKDLSGGEAVRIGGRGYAKDDVRQFIAGRLGQMSRDDLMKKLALLTLDRLATSALRAKSLEVTEEDLKFHFSYDCREREAATGAPGRDLMRREIEKLGMTPEQFVHSRTFKLDAMITRLAKEPINYKALIDEFNAHPERYKRSENMIAHIFVRVFDPENRPYTSNWMAQGHDAVNEYVKQQRERQFEAAKSKIEGLDHLARADFQKTAKMYSNDLATAPVAGTIGRIGAETILVPPCDNNVRDAAMKLKPGEVSAPIRSDYGWHILKCLEKQDVTFEEAQERVYLKLIGDARKRIVEEFEKIAAKAEDKF